MAVKNNHNDAAEFSEGGFHSWIIVVASSLIFFLHGCVFFTQGVICIVSL